MQQNDAFYETFKRPILLRYDHAWLLVFYLWFCHVAQWYIDPVFKTGLSNQYISGIVGDVRFLYFLLHYGFSISPGTEKNRLQKRHQPWTCHYGRGKYNIHSGCEYTYVLAVPDRLICSGNGACFASNGCNPYVTILGPEHSAAKRISFMGICNKIAGILSPIILGSIILKNIDQIIKQLESVTNDKM